MPHRQSLDLTDPANHMLFLDRMGRDVVQLKDEAAKESAHTRAEFSEMRQKLEAISEKLTPIQILAQDVRHLQAGHASANERIEQNARDTEGVWRAVRAVRTYAMAALFLAPTIGGILIYAYNGDRAAVVAAAETKAAKTVIESGDEDRRQMRAQEDKIQRIEIWAAGQPTSPYRR